MTPFITESDINPTNPTSGRLRVQIIAIGMGYLSDIPDRYHGTTG